MIKNTNIWQNFIDISERAILMIIAVATLYATGIEIHRLIVEQVVTLSDLFLLFIYAEVLGMVGSFYASNRLPVTLPIIIAMAATQNVKAAISQGPLAVVIGVVVTITGFLLVPLISKIGQFSRETRTTFQKTDVISFCVPG